MCSGSVGDSIDTAWCGWASDHCTLDATQCQNIARHVEIYASTSHGGWRHSVLSSAGQWQHVAMSAGGSQAILPCVLPVVGAAEARESDSDVDLDVDQTVEVKSQSCLEEWQRHPNYEIGMRMAQVSVFWISNGLLVYRFNFFVSWLHAQTPGMVGNLNHSEHFLDEFASSLGRSLKECTCAALHIIVLATGLPSYLTRVIDIVTIAGHSLVVIHIYIY